MTCKNVIHTPDNYGFHGISSGGGGIQREFNGNCVSSATPFFSLNWHLSLRNYAEFRILNFYRITRNFMEFHEISCNLNSVGRGTRDLFNFSCSSLCLCLRLSLHLPPLSIPPSICPFIPPSMTLCIPPSDYPSTSEWSNRDQRITLAELNPSLSIRRM